jgi:hypothetical protein
MAVCLFAQNREIFAKGLPIYGAASNLMHIVICSARRCAPPLFEEVKVTVDRVVLNALVKNPTLSLLFAPSAVT